MKLSDYLDETGETLESFARRIGRSAASVSRLANGKQEPGADTVRKIQEATKGAVMPNDLLAPRAEAAAE